MSYIHCTHFSCLGARLNFCCTHMYCSWASLSTRVCSLLILIYQLKCVTWKGIYKPFQKCPQCKWLFQHQQSLNWLRFFGYMVAAIICKNVHTHQIWTQWCVCYIMNLLCFSTAVLLLFAADSDELIFLLFDGLSKTVIVRSCWADQVRVRVRFSKSIETLHIKWKTFA